VLIVLVGLIGLGNWQLDRKVWKEDLIARLGQRLAAAPSELPPPGLWSSLSPATDEFRRVRFAAQVLPHEEALVFTSGSAFRPDGRALAIGFLRRRDLRAAAASWSTAASCRRAGRTRRHALPARSTA